MVMVTVAVFEVPPKLSVTWYVKLSVPVNPVEGVYVIVCPDPVNSPCVGFAIIPYVNTAFRFAVVAWSVMFTAVFICVDADMLFAVIDRGAGQDQF